MQISVEKISELSRKMTVHVPEELIQEKVKARLKSLSREVKLDGFRPGKVPQKVVEKMYGSRVRGEITGDLVQSSYYDALKEQDLKPAGPPNIVPVERESGFEYTADFEVYPEISFAGIEQIEVKKSVVVIEAADIDSMIEVLREQKKEWTTVQRAAQEHDRVTISFSGICDGENFTDGKVESYQVEVGAGQMIPGFEDNLIGLAVDANKTFECSFPEEYGNKKLAGKTAEFEVDVIQVEESVLPEVDTDFIKAYGIEEGDIDTFRKDVEVKMQRELDQTLQGNLKSGVMDGLNEKIMITLPKALIDQEIEALNKQYTENAKRQNQGVRDLDLPSDIFEEQAKRRVALGLILSEIVQKNAIKVDGDRVRSTIEDMAISYDHPEEVVNWYYTDESRLQEIEQMVLENQVVDWVLEQIKVTDESAGFDEIMNRK